MKRSTDKNLVEYVKESVRNLWTVILNSKSSYIQIKKYQHVDSRYRRILKNVGSNWTNLLDQFQNSPFSCNFRSVKCIWIDFRLELVFQNVIQFVQIVFSFKIERALLKSSGIFLGIVIE